MPTTECIATHLIENGHRHLCILANPSTGNVTTHRHVGIRQAVARLLEKIENPALPPKHTYIPGELIYRPSVTVSGRVQCSHTDPVNYLPGQRP